MASCARSSISACSRNFLSTCLRSVMSKKVTTPATIRPSPSRIGAELILNAPRVSSPRRISISSFVTISPALMERASGHSCD